MKTMEERSVVHSTFVIERSYPAPPERVFAAFADSNKKRRWFADSSSHASVEHYELDFRAGGQERVCHRFNEGSPIAGKVCTNRTTYQDIVSNRRIVFASTMALDEKCFSASLGTVELQPSATGTDLIFTHQGAFFEGADGPEMRQAGWRKLFESLAEELPR